MLRQSILSNKYTQQSSSRSPLISLGIVAFFTFTLVVLISRAAFQTLSHDEYQFVASGGFLALYGKLPYVDFPFLHMPYQPFFNAITFSINDRHFLTARLFNQLFVFFSSISLFVIIFKNSLLLPRLLRFLFASSAVLLFIMPSSFLSIDGRALNHAIPILLGILAYVSWESAINTEYKIKWIFLSGILAGLAIGCRLSYAVMIFPYLTLFLLVQSNYQFKQRVIHAIFYILGVFISLVPAGLLFLMNPRGFYYGNLTYIRLNTLYRRFLGYPFSMTLGAKITYFFNSILQDPISIIIFLGGFLALIVFLIKVISKRKITDERPFLLFTLSLVLLIAGFAPTPLWPQYFFAPIPFLIMAFNAVINTRYKKLIAFHWIGVVLTSMTILAYTLTTTIPSISKLHVFNDWVPNQLHEISTQIKKFVPVGKVLTLAPIIPLEVGLNTYEPFIVGPFSWRTAQFISPSLRQIYGIISPDDLQITLEDDPPMAILTGVEAEYEGFTDKMISDLEIPFENFAKANNYQPVDIPCILFSYCTLWVKND